MSAPEQEKIDMKIRQTVESPPDALPALVPEAEAATAANADLPSISTEYAVPIPSFTRATVALSIGSLYICAVFCFLACITQLVPANLLPAKHLLITITGLVGLAMLCPGPLGFYYLEGIYRLHAAARKKFGKECYGPVKAVIANSLHGWMLFTLMGTGAGLTALFLAWLLQVTGHVRHGSLIFPIVGSGMLLALLNFIPSLAGLFMGRSWNSLGKGLERSTEPQAGMTALMIPIVMVAPIWLLPWTIGDLFMPFCLLWGFILLPACYCYAFSKLRLYTRLFNEQFSLKPAPPCQPKLWQKTSFHVICSWISVITILACVAAGKVLIR